MRSSESLSLWEEGWPCGIFWSHILMLPQAPWMSFSASLFCAGDVQVCFWSPTKHWNNLFLQILACDKKRLSFAWKLSISTQWTPCILSWLWQLSAFLLPIQTSAFSKPITLLAFCCLRRQWDPYPGTTSYKIKLPLIWIYHLLISLNAPLFQAPLIYFL